MTDAVQNHLAFENSWLNGVKSPGSSFTSIQGCKLYVLWSVAHDCLHCKVIRMEEYFKWASYEMTIYFDDFY